MRNGRRSPVRTELRGTPRARCVAVNDLDLIEVSGGTRQMLAAKPGFSPKFITPCPRHAGAWCDGLRGRTGRQTLRPVGWRLAFAKRFLVGKSAGRASAGERRLSAIQRKPMNWFLWGALAAAAAAVVLFTALGMDAARGKHTDDQHGAVGATLLAGCVGVATVLGIIGLVVKFW